MAVALAVFTVGRISGAHINPAVTIGLASINQFDWALVPGYIAAQFMGAGIGSAIVYIAYSSHFKITENQNLILACHCTSSEIPNKLNSFVTETIGTFVLIFFVLSLGKIALGAEQGQEIWAETMSVWFVPLLVGLIVFSIGLSLGGPTGFAINPARDLAPRIIYLLIPLKNKKSPDWGYAWIPVLAPILGGIIGAKLFTFLNF
jgi:glycerol uptake facilitator protein